MNSADTEQRGLKMCSEGSRQCWWIRRYSQLWEQMQGRFLGEEGTWRKGRLEHPDIGERQDTPDWKKNRKTQKHKGGKVLLNQSEKVSKVPGVPTSNENHSFTNINWTFFLSIFFSERDSSKQNEQVSTSTELLPSWGRDIMEKTTM